MKIKKLPISHYLLPRLNRVLPITNRGFALVEVVMVVMIIGLIALLLTNLPSSINLNSNSKNQSLAKQIASQKLEDLRLQSYSNLANGTSELVDNRLNSLTYGTGTVTISDCDPAICTNQELLKSVNVQIDWKEEGQDKSINFTTLIGEGGLK